MHTYKYCYPNLKWFRPERYSDVVPVLVLFFWKCKYRIRMRRGGLLLKSVNAWLHANGNFENNWWNIHFPFGISSFSE